MSAITGPHPAAFCVPTVTVTRLPFGTSTVTWRFVARFHSPSLTLNQYVAKAPPALVEETRKKLAEIDADVAAAKSALAALG